MEKTIPDTPVQPILLLADSQLLFWRDKNGLFLDRLRPFLSAETNEPLRAAYIGASNGDDPAYYDIFVAAMTGIHIKRCHMIPSEPSASDFDYLDHSAIVLLAGGDVKKGWDVFQATGLVGKIVERYYAGAVLIGVSAGAVQLGLKGWAGTEPAPKTTFNTLQFIPFAIDVHDEPDWRRLNHIVLKMGENSRGLGISSGAGAIFYPDWSIEPVRHPLVELTAGPEGVTQALVFPSSDEPQ